MKKIKYLIVGIITLFTLNITTYAASGNISVSSGSVYPGDSFTVSANVYGAAAWNVHVSASGPVSGCVINQADATADAENTNRSFSASCTATGVGTITVTLSGDVSSSDGNTIFLGGSRSVSVVARPVANPSNGGNTGGGSSTTTNNSNNRSNSNNNANTNNEPAKSSDKSLKSIKVEGYDLTKINDNTYNLTVMNDVKKIKINADANDSKAKVSGNGEKDIKVGDNSFDIVITAEDGSTNTIKVNINRKEFYSLDDIDYVLKKDNLSDIKIDKDTTITKDILNKIKKSKRSINFNYYEDNKIYYSWIIDGKKINKVNDFLTTIDIYQENNRKILKFSNYADGLGIDFSSTKIIDGLRLKINISSKYKDKDKVHLYYYDSNNKKLVLVSNLKVENGYIEFKVNNNMKHFVTMSNLGNNSFNYMYLIIILLVICIIVGGYLLIVKGKINFNFKNNNKVDNNITESDNKVTDISNNDDNKNKDNNKKKK